GMTQELNISTTTAGFAAGVFFFGYLLFQVPGGHIAEKGYAKRFVALSILCWGGLSALTGLVTASWQLMALRFLLGVAEGGVWPAILVIISKWFPAEERGRANALFIMNINIAILVSSPVSGWIIQNFGWRNVFVIEGIGSMLLILVWWPLIDERPQTAKWISAEERDYLVTRIAAQEQAAAANGPTSYKGLLVDWNLWRLTAFYFFFQVGDIGFMMWLPTIIKELTNQGMTMVGMLSALPFFAAMAGLYLVAYLSDKSGRRKLYVAIPAIGFAAAFVLSVHTPEIALLAYGFLLVCGFFHNAYNGVFWALPPRLFASDICGGARGFINGVGNLGGFVGPFLVGCFFANFGTTEYGIYVLSGFLTLAFVTALTFPAHLVDNQPQWERGSERHSPTPDRQASLEIEGADGSGPSDPRRPAAPGNAP
ncbi:MAG: MFS transporter, partial [Acetobacteraceae bacterium]|nr:MFS transporter [Acetobacteraceae bacterium]